MGGIPTMLMMIAAAGVTYGWQPDQNGDDAADVQYIVQVSPSELAQLQRSGSSASSEISSVIDPRVRGHVSRIVLRVGTGDLPRTTPADLLNSRVATLKPDPQGGGGYGLPSSLQNSASDAVNNTANQFGNQALDRAGRAIQNGTDQAGQKANNLLDRIRGNSQDPSIAGRSLVPPPSTRPGTNQPGTNQLSTNQSNTNQPNPNLGNPTLSSNPFAQPRTGGPTTSPTGQNSQGGRDNQWSRFAAQQQQQNPRSADSSLASNGLRSSDTFGQMPNALQNSGLQNQNANENLFANRTGREQDAANSNDSSGIYSQIDQTKRDFQYGFGNESANNRSTASTQSTRSGYQQPRSPSTTGYAANDIQGSTRPNPKLTQAQLAAGGWDFDVYNRLIDRNGQVVRVDDRQPSFADRSANGTTANAYPGTSNPQQPSRLGTPSLNDPRGTSGNGAYDRSLASNTTSMQGRDPWGQPIDDRADRDRYLRDQDSRSAAPRGTSYPSSNEANRDPRYQDSRYVNSNSQYADRDLADQRYASRTVNDYPAATTRSTYDRSAAERPPVPNPTDGGNGYASNSSSDRVSQAGFVPQGGIIKPKPVAAQPLFNGLLLISIVANLYLIFWLKNLRVQFKDMVAAKRMASSSASVA